MPVGGVATWRIGEALMPDATDKNSSESDVVWLDQPTHPRTERVLSLPNVAQMFGVSTLMLRYYEFRGLVRRRQRQNGVWVYSWADCERLAFIIKCRRAGITTADIVSMVDA